jgi:hypothetical protein
MKTMLSENEVFAIRNDELVTITDTEPSSGRWFAVMARSVVFPGGPSHPVRVSDGLPVEAAAILACQKRDGLWQWMQLSPVTKENIGDLVFDSNAEKDRWYFVIVTQK